MATTNTDSLPAPKLLVGLGNPGQKYARTRHNIGFEVIDSLAKSWAIQLTNHKRFHGSVGETRTAAGDRLILLKPNTYMNRSGQAVRAVVDWYKLSPSDVLIIYDDMDLPIGKLRLRLSGSAGGHNGMKSIISHLGTQTFPRLRLGISRANNLESQANQVVVGHVLGKFAPDERKVMDAAVNLADEAIEFSLRKGIERAMSLYNGREVEV
ncbi:peptidyl-trna hydrolase [Leptolyngbya sp. Heron Island J]|uniref:aminoacyl-tRNA hydrolase n=1 Tax=Leptolyngbya sp. Heron Island J TaxID=1385935 RepID=UPI0003B94E75|nr:aminoacyl-tRNA hydrolase [Leptolyngbya sp. Heron Island J]ESA37818.1 peptidyl-trna hydrolase [Leptolyngbya sp. Heron Island J]